MIKDAKIMCRYREKRLRDLYTVWCPNLGLFN